MGRVCREKSYEQCVCTDSSTCRHALTIRSIGVLLLHTLVLTAFGVGCVMFFYELLIVPHADVPV